MPSRHRSRQRALQILYLCDMRSETPEQAMQAFYDSPRGDEGEPLPTRDSYAEHLVTGAFGDRTEIDQRILAHSEHWRLDRMPTVDRNILRLAIYEMMKENTPHAVVIDEALELARRFSGEESVRFINGVLDAVRKGL